MKNKVRKIYYAVMMVAFIAVIAAGSYAYFSINASGNSNNVTVKTATLRVSYTDGAEVTISNAKPGDTFTKTFKVKNNSSIAVNYSIKLDNITNSFVNKNDVKINLTCNNSGPTASSVTFPSATSTLASGSIAANTTEDCAMVITYTKTTAIQNDDMGKTLKAKVQISET